MDRSIDRFDQLQAHASGLSPGPVALRAGRKPRVGVIHNLRSHRNKGQDTKGEDRPNVSVARPRTRDDIPLALAEFAREGIDYLIIDGGDGTVRDVLTDGQAVFGDCWPAVAMLPRGKTNALNLDLGAPSDWTIESAIDAFETGKVCHRRPLKVTREGSDELPLLGFVFGAGSFTHAVTVGQDAHDLGFFDSLAVMSTAAWGIMQALFGSDANRWRRGTPMTLTFEPSGDPVPRSAHGDPARRNIFLASTLERMPMGIKVYGPERPGLKMAIMDRPRRRLLASIPAILAGWQPGWLAKAGLHQLDAEGFSIDVAEPVIVDGEAFPAGRYHVEQGPNLSFVVP